MSLTRDGWPRLTKPQMELMTEFAKSKWALAASGEEQK